MMRLPTPLDDETESVVEAIIGCAIRVHRELGPGFLESTYRNALCLEFQKDHIQFETEKPVVVRYQNVPIATHRLDLVVSERVILELKSVERTSPVHRKQVQTYLRLSGCKLGYLLNFGDELMKDGITRVVNGLEEE